MIVLPIVTVLKLVDMLNEKPPLPLGAMPAFLNKRDVSMSITADMCGNASQTNVTDTEDYFEKGKQLFLEGKERPQRPPEDTGWSGPESAMWYGWMIERAHKIQFIMGWLKMTHDQHSAEYEDQLAKSIKAMDADYKLEKDDDITAHNLPPQIIG